MMWVIAEYQQTALFSLKPATATASGGKTLLVPTPFAIKMALLDVAIRAYGLDAARSMWKWLCNLRVAIRPPQRVVVNNTFIKILRPRRNPAAPGSADAGYFGRTIAYREYAYYDGNFSIAVETDHAEVVELLIAINYLGKRGSFIQIARIPDITETLPHEFILIDGVMAAVSLDGLLTQLDDTAPDVSFSVIDIYDKTQLKLNKHRLLHHVVLPYRLVQSSRGYSLYEWE